MFNITMNLNMIICGVSLLVGLFSPPVVLTANQSDPITISINHQIQYPCGGTANLAKNNCSGTSPSTEDIKYFMRLTKNLQRRVKSRESNYKTAFLSICNNNEYMDAAGDNIENNNHCEIPSSMTEVDMSKSSQNMLLVTKWLFWLKENEEKRYQQDGRYDFRDSFYSLANYSRSNLCYQEDNFCILQSDVDEVINCTLPTVTNDADPMAIIPESCYVLDKINSFSSIYKRSVRHYYRREKRNKCKKGKKSGKKCKKNRKNRKRNGKKNKQLISDETIEALKAERRNKGLKKNGGLKRQNRRRCSKKGKKRCKKNRTKKE